jgi:hypothetical protein
MTRLAGALALALSLTLLASGSGAQPRTEAEVKAAYLYTFIRFIEWPAARSEPTFSICVLGADPFGAVLDTTLAGTAVRGRKVVPRRLAGAADAAGCHVLFISTSEDRQLAGIVTALGRGSVLTVSDIPGFVGRGGMIGFHIADNRVRFQVDLQPARSAGLTMSSDLLRVASAVRGGKPGA